MCVDYMGLNKACLKDPFPLPRIDQVVDSTSGCKTLCFLDAYSGYHKIVMRECFLDARDIFHLPLWIVLLRHNAIRSEEHWGYVPALYAQVFQ